MQETVAVLQEGYCAATSGGEQGWSPAAMAAALLNPKGPHLVSNPGRSSEPNSVCLPHMVLAEAKCLARPRSPALQTSRTFRVVRKTDVSSVLRTWFARSRLNQAPGTSPGGCKGHREQVPFLRSYSQEEMWWGSGGDGHRSMGG